MSMPAREVQQSHRPCEWRQQTCAARVPWQARNDRVIRVQNLPGLPAGLCGGQISHEVRCQRHDQIATGQKCVRPVGQASIEGRSASAAVILPRVVEALWTEEHALRLDRQPTVAAVSISSREGRPSPVFRPDRLRPIAEPVHRAVSIRRRAMPVLRHGLARSSHESGGRGSSGVPAPDGQEQTTVGFATG